MPFNFETLTVRKMSFWTKSIRSRTTCFFAPKIHSLPVFPPPPCSVNTCPALPLIGSDSNMFFVAVFFFFSGRWNKWYWWSSPLSPNCFRTDSDATMQLLVMDESKCMKQQKTSQQSFSVIKSLMLNQIVLISTVCLLGYLHVTLLLVGTTTWGIPEFLTMSCQWIVSAWQRNLFWSTYTPPLRISGKEKREIAQSKQIHTRLSGYLTVSAWRKNIIQQSR